MSDNIKALTQSHPGLHGSYDGATHTFELFLTVVSDSYDGWATEAEQIRREASMRMSSLGCWVQDPSAPKLREKPIAAAAYSPEIDCFLPAVNVTCTPLNWEAAYNRASALAGHCTASLMRSGKLPDQADVIKLFGDLRLFYPDGGNSIVANMLRRMKH